MVAENSKKQRPRGKPFGKGQSGNPGGRPKLPAEIVELRALAREHTQDAVQAIIGVMGDEKASSSARVAAASEILDRGWGRSVQAVEHSGKDGDPIDMHWTVEIVKPK